jgi:hypothetical protein
MKTKYYKTLKAKTQKQVLSNVRWKEIESLLITLGAK